MIDLLLAPSARQLALGKRRESERDEERKRERERSRKVRGLRRNRRYDHHGDVGTSRCDSAGRRDRERKRGTEEVQEVPGK